MEKNNKPAITEPTLTQIYKTLVNFIDETRNNFSSQLEDRNHDYEQLQLCNRNIVTLEGKIENLVMTIGKMSDAHKRDSQQVTNEVEDLKETVAPKKVIVQEIPYFSFKLWLKHFLRR